MLVLTRRSAETIQIDNNIVIRVIDIRHGRVRLGIEAPREITILRSEIAESQAIGVVDDTTSESGADMYAVPVLPRHPR